MRIDRVFVLIIGQNEIYPKLLQPIFASICKVMAVKKPCVKFQLDSTCLTIKFHNHHHAILTTSERWARRANHVVAYTYLAVDMIHNHEQAIKINLFLSILSTDIVLQLVIEKFPYKIPGVCSTKV